MLWLFAANKVVYIFDLFDRIWHFIWVAFDRGGQKQGASDRGGQLTGGN